MNRASPLLLGVCVVLVGIASAHALGSSAAAGSPTTVPTMTGAGSPGTSGSGGRTWVVAVDGSDDASGDSVAPVRTVGRALTMAGPGDTVLLRAGRFAGFDVGVSGAPGRPLVIAGDPAGGSIIDGRIDGRRDTVHILPGAGDLVLRDLTVTGSSGSRSAGILVDGDVLSESAIGAPVTIERVHATGNDGFGVLLLDRASVSVTDSEIDHDQIGIEVNGDGRDVTIRGNRIHDHDRLMRATPRTQDANDDYGAIGVSLVHTMGPVLVEGNDVWANRAPSSDYGWDGSGFEIFGASGITIRDNRAWDDENVLETGTDGLPCAGDSFVRNVAWGAASGGRARGLILRCGEGMLLANDTLVDLDDYAVLLGTDSRRYSGSIAGARLTNTLLVMADPEGAPLVTTTTLPDDLGIDHVLLWNDRGPIARVAGQGATDDLARLTTWLPGDAAVADSLQAAPRFEGRRLHDYRLRAGSPAIDAGVVVPGVTDGWVGGAPDLGALESVAP